MTEPVVLPDRVTVLTCIGCGAMGRQEGCASCNEHRLELVSELEFDELRAAARAAHARAARLALVARELLDTATPEAWPALRDGARRALREVLPGPAPEPPSTVIGWWCDRCGNVDMPRPCIGVCVWRPAGWVNVARYEGERERARPHLEAARRLGRLVTGIATVTPRAGQWQRNADALREQARAALAAHTPDAPVPDAPPASPPAPESPVRVHPWPR